MPVKKTNFGCPDCGAQIVAENRQLRCSANSAHNWNDIDTFMRRGPKVMYEGDKPPVAPQTSYVKIELSLPPRIKQGLEAKYGSTHSGKIAETLGYLSEGDVLLIPQSDLQRIKERLGRMPENSGDLFGMIYSLSMDVENEKLAKETAEKDLKAYEGRSVGTVMVELGSIYPTVVEKARDSNIPLKMYVENCLKVAFENGWF